MGMTGGARNMIAGCIEKMRRNACGTCERRDACVFLWSKPGSGRRKRTSKPWSFETLRAPFLSFLGEVTRAVERAQPRPTGSAFRAEVEAAIELLLDAGEVRIERIARDLGVSRQNSVSPVKVRRRHFRAASRRPAPPPRASLSARARDDGEGSRLAPRFLGSVRILPRVQALDRIESARHAALGAKILFSSDPRID